MNEMPYHDMQSVISFLRQAEAALKEEPAFLELSPSKPLVIAGDTHGDVDITREILRRYLSKAHILFLGDYVDRALTPAGSIQNALLLMKAKVEHPDDVSLLRGNHEFLSVFSRYGFLQEMVSEGYDDDAVYAFEMAFSELPYVAVSDNGLLCLHGGPPAIETADDLRRIPKGLLDFMDNKHASQTVWSNATPLVEDTIGYEPGARGFETDYALRYNGIHVNRVLGMLGKRALVRGHDQSAKGFSFADMVLTIFTATKYKDDGVLKGVYVAVADPQKTIESARDLEIVQLA